MEVDTDGDGDTDLTILLGDAQADGDGFVFTKDGNTVANCANFLPGFAPGVRVADSAVNGNRLGFFVVQNGAARAADLSDADDLGFIASNGGLADVDDEFDFALTASGDSAGVTTVHSEKAIWNTDDQQHALPGTARGGEAMIIGFEDLTGTGGFDFEDVVFFDTRVEADAV
ncbi:hypothetical protein RUESEDTHA_02053 [Ruegeria sp. THAF57]|uniref:DUF4114 domain-containing protein n=1 Tax=Ruegeria sp. THAF57 TaxID=2744555 RepID=UPI0015DE5AC3|nr:DUF4114 domain-containing protein [Ruegeria sp. THAF57]CAD0185167.1 hypothetical protein RUESEDTHA_02053 [Ruegeria sp. THAF57]